MTRIAVFPSLRHEVDRLFDSLIHSAWANRPGETSWMPATDMSEDPTHYRIEIDLPGVPDSGISLTAEGRNLRVEGVRERVRMSSSERHHALERSTGRFVRNFRLPADADLETLEAHLDQGVLTLAVRRSPKGRVR